MPQLVLSLIKNQLHVLCKAKGEQELMQSEPALKTKVETTKITISENTKRTNGKPNELLSPKRLPLSYLNLTN